MIPVDVVVDIQEKAAHYMDRTHEESNIIGMKRAHNREVSDADVQHLEQCFKSFLVVMFA